MSTKERGVERKWKELREKCDSLAKDWPSAWEKARRESRENGKEKEWAIKRGSAPKRSKVLLID